MGARAWVVAAAAFAALLGGAIGVASDSLSATTEGLRALVGQAGGYPSDQEPYPPDLGQVPPDQEALPDEAMSPPIPSQVPNPEGEGRLAPPGDQVLDGQGPTGGEAVEGGEAVSPGDAVTGSNSGLSSGPTTPEPRANTEPVMPPPGPTPPPQPGAEGYPPEEAQPGAGAGVQAGAEGHPEEEAQPGAEAGAQPGAEAGAQPAETEEELQARISELEASLAEQQAAQEEQAAESDQRISELEDDFDDLQQRGAFLEENRASRLQRLQSGIDGIRYVFGVLAVGSSDLDGDLEMIADELQGAAQDASRYAGSREAALASRSEAAVQAAREAIAREDLYAARINLGFALADARAAQAAASDGTQSLFR